VPDDAMMGQTVHFQKVEINPIVVAEMRQYKTGRLNRLS